MTWIDIMKAAEFATLNNDNTTEFESVTFEHTDNGIRYRAVLEHIELSGFWVKEKAEQ